jgi:hypothetical protein
VSTSGSATSQVLTSSTRDVRGNLIKDGTGYKVYVLTVGNGNYSGPNVLSAESAAITLSGKIPVISVTNVTYSVSNGSLFVSFNKSSLETNIAEYRVYVVPSNQGFGSADALAVQAPLYSSVVPNGTNPTVVAAAKDVNGTPLTTGVKYKVYVLAVANSSGLQSGGLSNSSDEFQL